MSFRHFALLVALAAFACPAAAAPQTTSMASVAASPAGPPQPLTKSRIAKFQVELNRHLTVIGRSESVSMVILDAESGQVLFERTPGQALVPASNTKVFTAAAALAVLGADYRFETTFTGSVPPRDGVVAGDLIVTGTGDPTIGERFLETTPMVAMSSLAQKLIDAGLRRVDGAILADVSAFNGPATGESWPHEPYWKSWMVEVSPLVFNENQVTLRVMGQAGGATVRVEPDIGFVTVHSKLTPVRSAKAESIHVVRGEDGRSFTLTGKIWDKNPGHDLHVNVADGALYFVAALRAALRERGVHVGGSFGIAQTKAPAAPAHRVMTYTAELMSFLPAMLQESNNLHAELIFRTLGRAALQDGSFRGGWRAMYAWLGREGLFESGTMIADGSGLSRANACSARQLAKLLHFVWHRPDLREPLRTSLAVPGGEGTLRKRLPDLAGKLFAKTGTLSGVSTLSGYAQDEAGRWLIFAFLFNDNRGRARSVQDKLCRAMVHSNL
jgi:serine-type D-Ala-D-Ala carboxypeptidase/endopeptidase (penicillin-binding protein 4)